MKTKDTTTNPPARPPDTRPLRGGRRFAYLGVMVGLVASIAANIAHEFVTPAGRPTDRPWAPEHGAVLLAVFWPVALLLATEILTRKRWARGWVWVAVRLAGLVPVAGVAAVISYQHLHGLMLHYGESGLGATIGPLSIDGLMVIASTALIAPDRDDTPTHDERRLAATDVSDAAAATTPAGSPDTSRSDDPHTSPGSSQGSSRRASSGSPPRSPSRSSPSSPSGSPSGSSAGSSGAARRADDETLRALVAAARAERPGAGEPAVRRLLAEAGLSASAARVRTALTDPAPGAPPAGAGSEREDDIEGGQGVAA